MSPISQTMNCLISAITRLASSFQGFNLIPNLDALGNVELPLIYRGLGKQQRKEIAGELYRKLDWKIVWITGPNQLSGGQQQRVAVARAIAAQPPIILADEPTGNLDSKSTIEIMNILKDLHEIWKNSYYYYT